MNLKDHNQSAEWSKALSQPAFTKNDQQRESSVKQNGKPGQKLDRFWLERAWKSIARLRFTNAEEKGSPMARRDQKPESSSATLTPDQARRFERTMTSLIAYANDRLGIVDMERADTEKTSRLAQALVAHEIWTHPEVIMEFTHENPDCLPLRDLRLARGWKHAINDSFLVINHDEDGSVLVGRHAIFRAVGVNHPIESCLKETPVLATCTLLPAYGRIVVAGPVFGTGRLQPELAAELHDLYLATRDPKAITGGSAYERAAKAWRRLRDKEDEVSGGPSEQLDGFHKSALAGMSEEKREEATLSDFCQRIKDEPLSLNPQDWFVVEKDRDITSIDELVDLLPSRAIRRLAREAEVQDDKKAVAERYASSPELLEALLLDADQREYELFYKELKRDGVRIELDEEPSALLLDALVPYSCHFLDGNALVARACPEAKELAAKLDLKSIEEERAQIRPPAQFAAECVRFYGLIPVSDACCQYLRLHPDACTPQQFEEALRRAEALPHTSWELWAHKDTTYLADAYPKTALAEVFDTACHLVENDEGMEGTPSKEVVEEILKDGQREALENARMELLKAHEGYRPRPFPNDLEELGYSQWCANLPAAKELVSYFDHHVPDGENDMEFADNLMLEIIYRAETIGGTPRDCESLLIEAGYFDMGRAAEEELLRLVWDYYAQHPNKGAYGWSTTSLRELLEAK